MRKVYLVCIHSCDGNLENELFDIVACSSLDSAKKHLTKVVDEFEAEILPTYNEGEYSINKSSTYYWFIADCEDNNYYYVYIKDCEVITDECSN